ncbi:MAG: amidohydrolase family protein [Candidatus Solibacter usitatus]|nr:amidohydrolase family protein [Candidatus Solibacter usitatus]
MITPWGELAVADAHVHFFSRGFLQLLARQREGLTLASMEKTLGWEMPHEDPALLAQRWASELDHAGVERAALIASLPGDEDSVAAAVAALPGRFYGFFMANPCAPDAAAKVAQRLAAGGLRVPCLFPAMHQYSLHDTRAVAFLEAVSAAKNPVVFVHCGVLSVGIRAKLELPSLFDMRFSNPIDLHGLALRFPKIRFIVPHFGAGYFREALMLVSLCPNVYLDTSSTNSWMRLEGCSLESVFERALKVAGASRLLFGTDSSFFPRGWHRAIFDAQCGALQSLGIEKEDAASILGGNLKRLLS